jgi:anti-sigma B factor antagonist
MEFNYKKEDNFGISIFSLSGNLIEKSQAVELTQEVEESIENRSNKFIFDLENLRYMNSSGLNSLISILTKARKSGGELVITNVSPKVKELFLITKLNTVFTVTDSMDKAVSKLK